MILCMGKSVVWNVKLSKEERGVVCYLRLNKSRYALLFLTWLIFESGWSMMVFIVWEFRVSFCGVYFACETILVIVRDSYHYSFVSEGKKKKKLFIHLFCSKNWSILTLDYFFLFLVPLLQRISRFLVTATRLVSWTSSLSSSCDAQGATNFLLLILSEKRTIVVSLKFLLWHLD